MHLLQALPGLWIYISGPNELIIINMKAGERTKQMFMDTAEELFSTLPVDDVTVTEICAACNTDRTVFYYHFKDKYDLLAWIFMRDMTNPDGDNPTQVLPFIRMCSRNLWKKRDFYRQVLSDQSTSSIVYFIEQYDFEDKYTIMKAFMHAEELDRQMFLQLRYHSYATTHLAISWIRGNIQATVDEISQAFYNNYPPLLIEACEWYYTNDRK